MKVSELQGADLDYWVAKAIGHDPEIGAWTLSGEPLCRIKDWNRPGTLVNGRRFEPHRDWQHGGPIIERERINLYFEYHPDHPQVWHAMSDEKPRIHAATATGETPLLAAMRCFVASKFGPEVPDEKEQ